MAAPICPHIREILETMGNPMVELLFIRIGFRIRFADALCDDFGIAFLVASILAILALHTGGVLQKFSTQCATHDIVELLKNKFVAVEFVNFFLALPDGTSTINPATKRSSIVGLFCWDL